MQYLMLPEISSVAGRSRDGVIVGRIAQSQLLAARAGVLQASTIYALRRDVNGADSFSDVSVQAIGTVADSFLPWGTDATFSAADELWLAADKNICAVYVEITTPGVWTGTGLSVLESTDGETLVNVGNLVDGSNGLRNAAGIYGITFDANGTNRKTMSPIFGGTKRKYVVLRPNGLTAKTTSPKLRRIWLVCPDDGITYSDISGMISGGLTDATFANSGAETFHVVGDVIYYALPGISIGLDDAVFRAARNRSGVYEYLASDDVWKTHTVADGGNQLRSGPSTLGATGQNFALRWTPPSDWTVKSLTLAPAAAQEARWLRFRVTGASPLGPVPIPLYRRRARVFGSGNASGIYHKTAIVYSYATFEIGVPSATDLTLAICNAITGDSRSITIPADSASSALLANGRLDFADLTIGAGEHLLIYHVAGTGTARDARLQLR